MTETADRTRRLLARELGVHVDQVVDTARLSTDLAADHIDIVNVAMELEDEFGVTITDEEMDALDGATVADVVALIKRALQPASAAA